MPDKSPPENRHQLITVYGRNAVFEALCDPNIACHRLHWATSNKESAATERILSAAASRGVPVREHSRTTLSRISRNGKQDQGVALDIHCPEFATPEALFGKIDRPAIRVLALDGITNPQNVGMIIRAAVAGGMDAILYPQRGVAALGPLVIKASAGVIFRAPIVRCDHLQAALEMAQNHGFAIATLEGRANTSLFDYKPQGGVVYVLGGETQGVARETSQIADVQLGIPMAGQVESLNVAMAAVLVAYHAKRSDQTS